MFTSKLGCPERRRNRSLSSKCRFKNLKIHQLLFLVDLEKKYRNESEFDEKQEPLKTDVLSEGRRTLMNKWH